MKVIIIETCGKEAVALEQSGRFVKIRNLGYQVGQEIHISPEMLIRKSTPARTIQKIAAIAACFCILFGAVIGLLITNSQPYGYVSVDVNPSIEYRINRFGRVLCVNCNEDGAALIASIGIENMEGKDIEVALSLTVNELSVQGYLKDENTDVLITSSANSKKVAETLSQKLLSYTAAEEKLQNITLITASVSFEMVEEAEKLGTTAGKLFLIKSIGEDVNVQEWIDKSVTEIYHAVKENGTELPTSPVDPETEIQPLPDVTGEPETTVGTDEETATSEPVTDTIDTPNVTDEQTTETVTEPATETESETETESATEPESETESETEKETEKETESITETETEEEHTWPETFPDELPSEWPEEWPEPETDEDGNVVLPEPENKPWWWIFLEWIFGWR